LKGCGFILIKRTAMHLLSEFILSQRIRLVGDGVLKLRKQDKRRTDYGFSLVNPETKSY